ncbi:STM4014 family protein [Actinomadura scrupuli]|uniref:STM4014 family protein n=1 Tax=Actinomadura scrupuli TaxID=559629 RepID=UPI003D99E9DD
MTFTVVGTPGDRRTALFAAACAAQGLREPRLVPWREVLSGGEFGFEPGTLLRVDSPGEDAGTDALLRGPGHPARVGGGDGARWYATFTAALRRIEDVSSRVVPLSDPGEIAVMFDKRLCHARLEGAGVPVPPALPPVRGYRELRERMAEAGWSRVFVKPAHGSSASGVVAFQVHGARIKALTSAVPGPDGGLRNSLRVRSYESEPEVRALIDLLAPEGLHVERWLPKASLAGRALDLRVVVVSGTPTHAVVRTSRGPMTNLHLGGARGDLGAVRGALGETGWRRALDLCARAAACFPGSLMVGVDLLVASGWRRYAVGEVNAFGDLLPGLTGLPGSGAEGADTYTTQVRAALSRRLATCPA